MFKRLRNPGAGNYALDCVAMDRQELKAKLRQIEEQAQLTLAEFPKMLTKERQRMIVALVRYMMTELDNATLPGQADALDLDPDRTMGKSRH